ncbi:MAG: glycosyltransferase family 4 protein [Ferruginibacter sp.]
MKILLLVPAPEDALPSQRFRFEQYVNLAGIGDLEFVHSAFYTTKSWSFLYRKNHLFEKLYGVTQGLIKRFLVLFSLYKYQFIYIHREVASIGPPVFEWLIAIVFRKKIIYDFDDAIWVRASSEANPLAAKIKCAWKVKYISKWSHIITVGNYFLADFAKQYCRDVRIIPSVVNTSSKHNQLKKQDSLPLTIGWTGTFTNLVQLETIIPVIKKLQENYDFTFFIVANKDPMYQQIKYVYKPWDVNTEIKDLLKMHIGVMPLGNTVLELGKCAFKAIQYMSLGIPAVVSAVGANKDVVTDGVNGYWASNEEEWFNKLELLLRNTELRSELGKNARARIISNYSVESTKKDFFDLFT